MDTAGGKITVRAYWDPKEGPLAPKSRTSRRTVPLPGLLRDLFVEQRMTGDVDDEPGFGLFARLGVDAGGDHEARGGVAGLVRHSRPLPRLIGAVVERGRVESYMGHSSIKVTLRPLWPSDVGGRGRGHGSARCLPCAGRYRCP